MSFGLVNGHISGVFLHFIMATQGDFLKVVKEGTFNGPTSERHTLPGKRVECDRCYRRPLPASVGLGEIDLCLECVEELSRLTNDSGLRTLMMQSSFPSLNDSRLTNDSGLRTLMMQSSFLSGNDLSLPGDDSGLRTLMMQSSFSSEALSSDSRPVTRMFQSSLRSPERSSHVERTRMMQSMYVPDPPLRVNRTFSSMTFED